MVCFSPRARLFDVLTPLLLLGRPSVVHARLRHFATKAVQSTGQLFCGLGGNVIMQHSLQTMVQKPAAVLIDVTSWNRGYRTALVAACGLAGLSQRDLARMAEMAHRTVAAVNTDADAAETASQETEPS